MTRMRQVIEARFYYFLLGFLASSLVLLTLPVGDTDPLWSLSSIERLLITWFWRLAR